MLCFLFSVFFCFLLFCFSLFLFFVLISKSVILTQPICLVSLLHMKRSPDSSSPYGYFRWPVLSIVIVIIFVSFSSVNVEY